MIAIGPNNNKQLPLKASVKQRSLLREKKLKKKTSGRRFSQQQRAAVRESTAHLKLFTTCKSNFKLYFGVGSYNANTYKAEPGRYKIISR